MINQLVQVAKTYLTRKLLWLGAALVLFFVFTAVIQLSGEQLYSNCAPSVRDLFPNNLSNVSIWNLSPADRAVQPEKFYNFGLAWHRSKQERILPKPNESAEMFQQRIDVNQAVKSLQDLSNLEGVLLYDLELNKIGLEHVSQIRTIKYLSLAGTQIQAADLELLANLTQLEMLDLSQCDVAGGLHHLSELEHLHTLIFGSLEHVTDATLADLAHLPHLETLVLGAIYSTNGNKFVSDAGLQSLNELPTLKRVYAASNNLFKPAKQIIHNATVYRKEYKANRPVGCLMFLASIAFATVILSSHLGAQFSTPAAKLMPRFVGPHLFPVFLLIVFMIAFGIYFQVQAEASLWSIMSLALFGCGVSAYGMYGTMSQFSSTIEHSRFSGLRNILMVVTYLIFPVGIYFGYQNVALVEGFLLGDFPVLAGVLAVVGLTALDYCLRRVVDFARLVNEADIPTIMMNRKIGDWNSDLFKKSAKTSGMMNRLNLKLDRFLERYASRPHRWSRIFLWRAGNPDSTINIFYFICLVLLILWGYGQFSGEGSTGRLFTAVRQGGLFGFIGPLIILPVVNWRQRTQAFGWELLHPVSRPQFSTGNFFNQSSLNISVHY